MYADIWDLLVWYQGQNYCVVQTHLEILDQCKKKSPNSFRLHFMAGKENMPRAIVFVSLPVLSEAVKHSCIQMSEKKINFGLLQRKIPSQKRTFICFENLCIEKLSKMFWSIFFIERLYICVRSLRQGIELHCSSSRDNCSFFVIQVQQLLYKKSNLL